MNRELNERLIDTWLRMSAVLRNGRLMDQLSFNEAMVCHYLQRHEETGGQTPMTATDLCEKTKMLKSLMNSTLKTLEKKRIIERKRSDTDKRQINVFLREGCISEYRKEHEHILELVGEIVDAAGTEEIRRVIPVLNAITDCVETLGKTKPEE